MMIKRGIATVAAVLSVAGCASSSTLVVENQHTYDLIMQTGEESGLYYFIVRQTGPNKPEIRTRDLTQNWQEVERLTGNFKTTVVINVRLHQDVFSCAIDITPEEGRNYIVRPIISTAAEPAGQCTADVFGVPARSNDAPVYVPR